MNPYYQDDYVTIYHGDCRDMLSDLPTADVVIADPPCGETSLGWDRAVDGWLPAVRANNLWCFGSMRFFLGHGSEFVEWRFAQDIIWEKHNGSIFHADRFRRVHEHILQFYRGAWGDIYRNPVKTLDATARTLRRKRRPAHSGDIGASAYASQDGGPRLQRSVIKVSSTHGYAQHPTQKPVGIISPLLEYSCPPGGLVLDPFIGAGSSAVAAKDAGMRCIGIDIDEACCEVSAGRCSRLAHEATA